MKLKSILICLCLMVLTGCGTNTDTPKKEALYEGMDGRKTYQEVIKKMNDEVTYFKSETDDNYNKITSETYKIKNQFCFVSKSLFEEGASQTLSYTMTQGTDFHTLFMGMNNQYEYELVSDYPNIVEKIYIDYLADENYKVYDIQREDTNGQIVLTVQLEVKEITGGGEEYTETKYSIDEIVINQKGYISQEKSIYYTDNQFKTPTNESKTIVNSDFNKKTEKDFNDEIELMKSCDGLNDKEVKEKLKLS